MNIIDLLGSWSAYSKIKVPIGFYDRDYTFIECLTHNLMRALNEEIDREVLGDLQDQAIRLARLVE